MKRSGFTAEQIIGVLQEHAAGMKTADDRKIETFKHVSMQSGDSICYGLYDSERMAKRYELVEWASGDSRPSGGRRRRSKVRGAPFDISHPRH
jgi:hypothetical protein